MSVSIDSRDPVGSVGGGAAASGGRPNRARGFGGRRAAAASSLSVPEFVHRIVPRRDDVADRDRVRRLVAALLVRAISWKS